MANNKDIKKEESVNTDEKPEVSTEKPELEPVSDEKQKSVKVKKDFRNEFRVGDKIVVNYKITEGDKTRIQPFEGTVIAKRGSGVSKTFTVRRISVGNVGVERIFPLFSPNVQSIEIKARGKVRRAKLYYLRKRVGRAALKVKSLD